jgi:hypothetical protein
MFSLIGMAGLTSAMSGTEGGTFIGMLFGVGAIVILPICYGIMGFIISFISAALFNVAAGMTGGIEITTKP